MAEMDHVKNMLVSHIQSARDMMDISDFKWVAVERNGRAALYLSKPEPDSRGRWSYSDSFLMIYAPIAKLVVSDDFDWQSAIFSIDELLGCPWDE